MKYKTFKNIFNKTLFEKSRAFLIEKIAKHPNRYIGLFRPINLHSKMLQNLQQSYEIRFGTAFEKVFNEYFKEFGYKILNTKLVNAKEDRLNLDHCFRYRNKVYFIEQKIRDDHDSTKKRGQIENFRKKIDLMVNKYKKKSLVGIFYFIDPQLHRNKNYYEKELKKLSSKYGVKLYLFYGSELFEFLGKKNTWYEMINHLMRWKKEIPTFPVLNPQVNGKKLFEEIKELPPHLYKRLFQNDVVFNEIVLTIFPVETLDLLLKHFRNKLSIKSTSKVRFTYKIAADLLEKRLSNDLTKNLSKNIDFY